MESASMAAAQRAITEAERAAETARRASTPGIYNISVNTAQIPRGPIIEFHTQEELDACLREWQRILFLDDWIITANFVEPHEMKNRNCAGENEFQPVNRCAAICILKSEHWPPSAIAKQCQEVTLIHELLHCKFLLVENDRPSVEDAYYETAQHAMLEQMAKSLIMAKWGITFDWFRNL